MGQQPNPLETVRNLIEAINRGDLDAALSLYEPEAVMIARSWETRLKEETQFARHLRDSFH